MIQKYSYTIFAACLVVPMLTFISGSCRTNMSESSSTRSPRVTVEGTNQLVAKEVPIGSSKPQVIAFLDVHKIQHSAYSEHPERESDFRDARLDKKRKLIKGY